MKKKIMTLMMGTLLLLTACGQAKDSSASAMLPVAAVQSAAQAVAPVEDKTQEDAENLPAEEDTEEAKSPGGEGTPKPTKDAETPSGTEKTPSSPTGEKQTDVPEQPTDPERPTMPEQPVTPEPIPVPVQTPAEEQTVPEVASEPAPAPEPIASGDIYSIAEAVRAGNAYAATQYGVTIDTSMTVANSSFFPGTADSVTWLAENGGQAALTAAVRGNVDATFSCLAAMDGAETVSAYARFNCTARYNAASDEYIVVVLYG